MRVLYVTTVGLTMFFFKSIIKKLVDLGNIVDVACNDSEYKVDDFFTELGCNIHHISCVRTPFSLKNLTAIKELKTILEKGNYDIVHCHTPIAAAVTRLACKNFRKSVKPFKVIYTAHGFHFYSGSPVLNWLIFYPIEKLLAKYTDCLITINKEDYSRAKAKFKTDVRYIPGVGINVDKFSSYTISDERKNKIRNSIGMPEDAKLLLSVGELNKNKNHETVIKALGRLVAEKPSIQFYYVVAGEGLQKEHLLDLAKELNISDRVKLLGYRKDVIDLYKVSDVFIHPSFREGLPVSVMEAIASGLPVIASKIRGNSDLVKEEWLFEPKDEEGLEDKIKNLLKYPDNYKFTKINSISEDSINTEIMNIYKAFCKRKQ